VGTQQTERRCRAEDSILATPGHLVDRYPEDFCARPFDSTQCRPCGVHFAERSFRLAGVREVNRKVAACKRRPLGMVMALSGTDCCPHRSQRPRVAEGVSREAERVKSGDLSLRIVCRSGQLQGLLGQLPPLEGIGLDKIAGAFRELDGFSPHGECHMLDIRIKSRDRVLVQ
jgi:hypothetical protein